MTEITKFALYDFAGKPREFFIVSEDTVPKPVLEPTVSHHVVVIDRSGSMYSVMDDTKVMVEKVMCVEEYRTSGLLLTLISYSSKGDYTVHFSRTKVEDVLAPGSAHVKSLRSIRATCLTSVSGALNEALNHIAPGETTAITVHTDGWFNDASPASESKEVNKWIKRVQKELPNVFVNTVAYGSYTDFAMLDRMSQSLSGKTVIAKTVRQVYDALHDTTALLAGRVLPTIHVSTGEDNFLAFHNVTQKKVNGSTTDFGVRGVGPDDETKIYRYRKVSEETWKRSPTIENTDMTPVYVYARTMLGQQRINDAKYATVATRDADLVGRHYKALTAEQLSAFAEALDARIAGDFTDFVQIPEVGLGFGNRMSVLEVCQVLDKYKGDFTLDLAAFTKSYLRRGVSRVFGRWSDEGAFAPSATKLVAVDEETNVSVTAFDLSNAAASINMTIQRDAVLYRNGEKVTSVAGKKLDLKQIRSYTLVGDGEINADTLPIRIADKRLHDALVAGGVLPAEVFSHKPVYAIPLHKLAACPFGTSVAAPTARDFDQLRSLTFLRGMFSAALGTSAKAEAWTAEQLVELKEHDLTPALWYSPATTNPYRDLTQAVTDGEIDSRTTYKVTVGDAKMVSLGALYSANAYLARRFTVTVNGEEIDKPKLSDARQPGAVVSVKALSARTKLNDIDAILFPTMESFVMPGQGGAEGVHITDDAAKIATVLGQIEDEIESLYAEKIRPMAFQIGATGLVPDGWDVKVLDAEALEAAFPGIDIEKKQKDGTFLVVGEVVIGVFSDVAYFSTEKGVAVAKALANGEEAA
jgi:hypothetical protein